MSKPGKRKRSKAGSQAARASASDAELTLKDAAREFGVSVRTLHRFRADGRLPGTRRGRCIVVRREDVKRAVEWTDPTSLLRSLLKTHDRAPLEEWMEGWKQLTRLTASDAAAEAAWIAWADAAIRQNPGRKVGEYRVSHLIRAADHEARHPYVERMIHSMRSFDGNMIARDALRSFHTSVAPWVRA
jgi:excisionase family DNA binding protein